MWDDNADNHGMLWKLYYSRIETTHLQRPLLQIHCTSGTAVSLCVIYWGATAKFLLECRWLLNVLAIGPNLRTFLIYLYFMKQIGIISLSYMEIASNISHLVDNKWFHRVRCRQRLATQMLQNSDRLLTNFHKLIEASLLQKYYFLVFTIGKTLHCDHAYIACKHFKVEVRHQHAVVKFYTHTI